MEDIIYEKDYRDMPRDEEAQRANEIFVQALKGGFFEAYNNEMDKFPKVVVPEDKANYEYLLERCDKFAQRHRGQIRGIVDYHRWHSEIVMLLSFAEFCDPDDLAFLREITEKSHSVCFEPTEDGNIRFRIYINYFDEIISDEHKAYIEYDSILQDDKLSSLLGIPSLSPDEEELAQRMNDILDRFESETDFDRTTVFKAVLEKVTKEPEENQTFERILALLALLLDKVLNEESNDFRAAENEGNE